MPRLETLLELYTYQSINWSFAD